MEGGRNMLWLALLVSATVSVSSVNGEAATGYGQPAPPTGPDTNVLCVSKCGTCPTVCTSSPPPPSPSNAGNSVNTTPPTPKSGSGGGYSSSPPSTPGGGQSNGGRPSSYYYLYTAAGSRSCGAGASAYAAVFLVLVSVVANLQ